MAKYAFSINLSLNHTSPSFSFYNASTQLYNTLV